MNRLQSTVDLVMGSLITRAPEMVGPKGGNGVEITGTQIPCVVLTVHGHLIC